YFATMKRINKEGPRPLGGFRTPPLRPDEQLADPLRDGALVIDTRPALEFAAGHVPGTINIPFNNSFVTWAGWLVPYGKPIHLIVDPAAGDRVHDAVRALALIGLDDVASVFHSTAVDRWPDEFGPLATVPQMSGADLAALKDGDAPIVIDVRGPGEWIEGHLPGARHIPIGFLVDRLDEIPRDRRVVLQCRTGARSSIAASLLRRHGVLKVTNLTGGIVAWEQAGLPITRD
ncbi:MAG: rhodanese-like domain-containing protein, partial [Vicinamibacteria bacterium]